MIHNLTPHTITVRTPGGDRTFPASGTVARVSMTWADAGDLDGIPVRRSAPGPIEGLPDPVDGTAYIVSAMIASHPDATGRTDIYSPGDLIRDDQGRPIACDGLRVA